MNYKDKIISAYAEQNCAGVSNKVIKNLRKMTDGMQSGDDSPLKNIWDEVCVQMQGEQSALWDAYEDVMDRFIQNELDPLNKEVVEAVWLQTDEGQSWDWDNQAAQDENESGFNDESQFYYIEIVPVDKYVKAPNVIPDTVEYDLDDVIKYIREEYVLKAARDWKNKRIEKFLDGDCEL